MLAELLKDLQKLTYSNLELLIVDNHSTDGTSDMVKHLYPKTKILNTDTNLGTAARNFGLQNARGDIIVTVDDDVFLSYEDSIEKIVEIFTKRNEVAAINFKITDYYSDKPTNWNHPYMVEKYLDTEFVTDSISEGAVAFRKDVLKITGHYPESFFISHEGADLACRIINSGFSILYSPRICVRHQTSPIARKNWRRYYYDSRNHIWLAVRNYRFIRAIKYIMAKLLITFCYSLRDHYTRYWMKGVMDGIKGIPEEFKHRSCITKKTEQKLKGIRKNRPHIIYLLKKKLKSKSFNL